MVMVATLGRFVASITDLKRQEIPAFVQRSAHARGEVGISNYLHQFVRDMGSPGVILYYIQWLAWIINNLIWERLFCCNERFKVLFHDYETRNFTDFFGKWVWVYFDLIPWKPSSSWDTHQPIVCVCEEKSRHIADMHGALEDFADTQLQKTIFVYITNDTENNCRMAEGDRYSKVSVICVPKERNWESANIFRKAVTSMLVQYKRMTIQASENTPLTNT